MPVWLWPYDTEQLMLNELANFSRRVEPPSSSMTWRSNTAFTPSPPFFMIFGWVPWPLLMRLPKKLSTVNRAMGVHGSVAGRI